MSKVKLYCPKCGCCATDNPEDFGMYVTYEKSISIDGLDVYSEDIIDAADTPDHFIHYDCGHEFEYFDYEEGDASA